LNAFRRLRRDFEEALQSGRVDEAMRDFIDFWAGAGTVGGPVPPHAAPLLALAPKSPLGFGASFAFDPGVDALRVLGGRTLIARGDRSPRPMQHLVDSAHGPH